MVTNETGPEIDLGPLSWVQGEIDHALARGLDALATFKAAPDDKTPLKQARAHVHQAAGAIQMVGLDAVSIYTDEIERQFARLDDAPVEDVGALCVLIDQACRKLKIFLDELVNGATPVPLRLFPEYEMMQQARGIEAVSPTDLFYPDLTPSAPKLAGVSTVAPAKLPSFLLKQRRHYQRGLLAWLRGEDAGAAVMRDAVKGIEDVQTQSSQRSFWWGVGALLESIVTKGVEPGFGVKQLCGRVDLQIRRFVEGSAKIADRMRREVLYYVAISGSAAPQVQAVQRAYNLVVLIPSAETLSADVVRVQPLLREARDHIFAAKDLWLKLAGGRAETLPKLKQTLSGLRDTAAGIGNAAFSQLVGALAHRVEKLVPSGIADALAMEYATALLLAESAVESYSGLSPDFPKQVEAMVARLDAAQHKRPAGEVASAPVLDEMAKRAQERMLLAHVAREIQANLRHIEQVLDSFFRDHGKRSELASLAKDSKQIAGALRMLNLTEAEQLLGLCQAQIDEYAKPGTAVANEDLELLAESLSGLGFYIEAVEQQRPDRARLIEPLLAKRLGTLEKPQVEVAETVETAVADAKAALPSALASFKSAPDDPLAREALVSSLESLRSDSELLDDTALETAADHALSLLSGHGSADLSAVDDAIAAIAGDSEAPAPAPSEETIRLLETDASDFDAELLDIFLTEAGEVLDAIDANRAVLITSPNDRTALTSIRRSFHTLKGSGRMVGLNALADLAYAVEKIHNLVLEEDHAVTPAFVAMVDLGARDFRTWVDALRVTGRVAPDGAPLMSAVARIEADLSGGDRIAPEDEAPIASDYAPAFRSIPAFDMSAIEVIDLEDAPPFSAANDAPTRAGSAEIIDFSSPTASATRPKSEGLVAVAAANEADEIAIGDVILSGALYRILCDEAQQHLSTLDHELIALGFDPESRPSQAMIRASHTLCGIHRTGGFPVVASAARALEQCLLALEDQPEPLTGDTHALLARAVNSLVTLVSRVRSRTPFSIEDETSAASVVEALDALRQSASSRDPSLDSDFAAALHARKDEPESGWPHTEGQGLQGGAEGGPNADAGSPGPKYEPGDEALPFSTGADSSPAIDHGVGRSAEDGADAGQPPLAGGHAREVRHELSGEDLRVDLNAELAKLEALEAGHHSFQQPLTTDASEATGRDSSAAAVASGGTVAEDGGEGSGAHDADLDRPGHAASPFAHKPLASTLAVDAAVVSWTEHDHDVTIETLEIEEPSATLEAMPYLESGEAAASLGKVGPGVAAVAATGPASPGADASPQRNAEAVPASRASADESDPKRDAGARDPAAPDVQAVGGSDAPSSPVIERGATIAGAMHPPAGASDAAPATTVAEARTDAESAGARRSDAAPATTEPARAAATQPVQSEVTPIERVREPVPPQVATAIDVAGREAPPTAGTGSAKSPAAGTGFGVAAMPATLVTAIVADPLSGVRDDIDAQLLPMFLEEGAELLPNAGEALRAWRRKPKDASPSQALQRTLHTLKGSARMAGAMRLGELTHLMESRLLVDDEQAVGSPELFDALETDLDHIAFVLEALHAGRVDVELPAAARIAGTAPAMSGALDPARSGATKVEVKAHAESPGEGERGAAIEATQHAMLRVRADIVDRLVNEAGEVAISRARVEGELRALKSNLLELTNSVIRLRAQVREIEIQAESEIQSHVQDNAEGFDPLEFDRYTRFQELTRGIAEGVNDVAAVQHALLKNLDDADMALLAQARLSREVQQQLFSIRTVPFATISERLYRILRRTAKDLDKRANLEIKGAQVELDRSVLEKLIGPLEHLLRNALDHGVEPRDVRAQAGKPETGEITLEVRQQGNEIMITLADDGAGLDYGRIRDKAVAQGLLSADAETNEAGLLELIFAPGFSTASKVTQISGRGVGMDVVRSDVAALGGRVEITTRAAQGTTFTLFLPLTLAVAQAVLVRAGTRLWALPSPMVEQVQQVKDTQLINFYLEREVEWQGRKYPFFYLPRLLGELSFNPEATRYNHVILLRSGQSTAAVHVDEMVGSQEVVVKNIGPQLARVSGIAGATVLGTGEVVLIINPVQLAQRTGLKEQAGIVLKTPQALAAAKAAVAAAGPRLAMVVDDSLTVRKITSRLLTREGYAVVTAKDGIDALESLNTRLPDVILLDIEMPRMDGFEFAKTVRSDTRTAHIPIVMITSRTADKHRARARELGVERYIGKPWQEEELLRSLRELLATHVA